MDEKKSIDSVQYRRTQRTTDDNCEIDASNKSDLLSLIKAAEINEDCSKLAAEIFQRKHTDKLLRIEKYPLPHDSDAVISISSFETATNMIKYFGNLIKKISIQINNDSELCTELQVIETVILLMAINARCRESLVEFELHYNGCNVNNIFHQFTSPFEHVEILSLHLFNMIEQKDTRTLQLNAIFPNVQELIIDFHEIRDSSFIDCEFSKLKKLGISDGLIYESNESILIDLLKKNPQITYISLIRPTLRALRLVNKHLMHLQDLHILMESQEEFSFSKITFPTVQRLNLWLSTDKCYPPKKIAFGTALREIALVCHSGDENDSYLNFLFKYPKIEKLSAGNGLNNVHLLKLIGKFHRLANVFFDFNKDVTVANIIEFIQRSPSLNRLEFVHAYIEHLDKFENRLKHELGAEFNIQFHDLTPSTSKRFIIERKIPIVNEPEVVENAAHPSRNVAYNTVIISVAAYVIRLLIF